MKVLLINGSPNKEGSTYTALHEVEKTLHKHNIETEILYLGKKAIPGCIACNYCSQTGYCFHNDVVKDIQQRLVHGLRANMKNKLMLRKRCIIECINVIAPYTTSS